MARIAMAGSSGMLGMALCSQLEKAGHEVVRLVRRATGKPREFVWNPAAGEIPGNPLNGCEAAINLAGESISRRWTDSARKRIVDSRVLSTRLLARECVRAQVPVLVNASATGIYGDRGDEILDESSPCGGGFLADTCVAWEHALRPAREAGIRTVSCRFGVVLSRSGGALPRMLPAFRAGLGGPLGGGHQWMPWIHLVDAVGAIEHAVRDSAIHGPILVTSKLPIRQSEFGEMLSNRCHHKVRIKTPAWMLRLLMGAMADELLLSSQRCKPSVLESTNFGWSFPDMGKALDDLLG